MFCAARAEVGVHTHDAGAVEEDVLRHTRDAELHALVKAGEGEALGRRGQDGPQVTGRIETGGGGERRTADEQTGEQVDGARGEEANHGR